MSEIPNGTSLLTSQLLGHELAKPMGTREFVMRYLKYLPWLLLSIALAIGGAFVKNRYSIPIYQVQSSLIINNDRSGGQKDDKLGELFMFGPSVNLSNEIEILRSRPFVERVVRDLGLQAYYYSKGNIRSTQLYGDIPFRLVLLRQVDSTIGFSFMVNAVDDKTFTLNEDKTLHRFNEPFAWTGGVTCLLEKSGQANISYYGSRKFLVGWESLTNTAEGLIGGLKIGQVNNSATILSISLETTNPVLGVNFLNTLMAVYDTLGVEDKNRIAINSLKFIDERLAELKGQLGNVENGFKSFLEQNQAYDIEGQSKAYMSDLSESGKALAQQEVKLSILNWLLDYIGNAKNYYSTVPTNLGIEEPSLSQLITEYDQLQLQRESNLKTTTPDNPLIRNLEVQLEKLRLSIHQLLLNVRQSYMIAKDNLEKQDLGLKSKLRSLPGKSMQGLTIERQRTILEELYSFLLKKKLETSISSASTISNSKVVEPAIGSDVPVKPDHKSVYISYLVIGLIIPVSLIALFELMNDKVNNRAEIERVTKTPILGEIGHSEGDETLVVTRNSRRFIAEQFRIVRTNLQYIVGKKEKPTILITSSFSGEGKSFISTNMGAVMALTGKKTVIMEFDIRKPKIISGLDLKRKTGITNYIIGKASFEDLLVPVEGVENLYVIPCGPIPPNPAEILLDPRLSELMTEVKEHFDAVIMDTAPVGLVSDAITLSQFADCTLYIVRRGHTVKRLLGLVDEIYINKKMPSVSLLLNDIKMGGIYGGGYYGGYGYYGYGYDNEAGYFEKEKKPRKGGVFGWVGRLWKRWFS
jgi:tyrosine-protein kinase Etk/Wzc